MSRPQTVLIYILLVVTCLAEAVPVIEVPVPQDVIDDYEAFVGDRSAVEIRQFSGPHARRDVVELILLQQAFAAAEYAIQFQWVPVRSYKKILSGLATGQYAFTANTVWHRDVRGDAFLPTAPLIHNGEFWAGFYTCVSNKKALAATRLEDLQELTAVSNSHWVHDWETLQALQFAKLRNVRSWESMVHLLALQRSDVTLAPFNASEGMRIRFDGTELRPIPGLKTYLHGERVWAVSAQHAQGPELYAALQRGLAVLREAGTVEGAYSQCGFFNPVVADWTLIVPEGHGRLPGN